MIIFTEDFISKHAALGNLIYDFPFFQLDKAIPFEFDETEVTTLAAVFENIGAMYQAPGSEQFNLIATYVKILLLHIREMYHKYVNSDDRLAEAITHSNESMANNFFTLVKREILSPVDENQHDFSVAYFAEKMNVHPNHLSKMLKRMTGRSAQDHIQTALLGAAKSLLVQTNFSMKEIAYRLSFKEPAHFANFFKKQENVTPMQYRKVNQAQ